MLNYYSSTQQMHNLQSSINELDRAFKDLEKLQEIVNEHWEATEINFLNMAIQQRRNQIKLAQSELIKIKQNIGYAIREIENEIKCTE